MDIALVIDYLIPGAQYQGAFVDDTEVEYNALTWLDTTSKPAWQAILDNSEAAYKVDMRKSLECTPLQLIRALKVTGDYDAVVYMISQSSSDVQESWNRSIIIYRNDPYVAALLGALERTDEEADQLFVMALTF